MAGTRPEGLHKLSVQEATNASLKRVIKVQPTITLDDNDDNHVAFNWTEIPSASPGKGVAVTLNSIFILNGNDVKDVVNSKRPNPYIFITDAAHGSNSGLFSLTTNSTSGKITLNKKISIDTDGDYTSTAASAVDGGSDEITIYNAFSEQITVYEGVEVMSGASAETFELDVSRYQANAIVYYMKAKIAEDAGDFDKREFFMREFKRQLEKGVGALKRGPYIVQGFKEMT